MSLWANVGSFAIVAGLLTIIPGLDTALVLRSAVTDGPRHGFATALGISTGALIWGAGAAAGVSALLAASTLAYTVVRIAGAAYMVWLGAGFLRRALRRQRPQTHTRVPAADSTQTPAAGEATTPHSPWRSWRRGLLTNLLNPKIGAFYVAVLPQFIPPDSPHVLVGVLLAVVHDLEGMLWFTALIVSAGRLRHVLQRPRPKRALEATTGTALVAFGVRIGTQAHS